MLEVDSSAKACCPQYAIPTTPGTENVQTTSMTNKIRLPIFLNLSESASPSRVLINVKAKTGIKNKSTEGLLVVGIFSISMIGTTVCSFVD